MNIIQEKAKGIAKRKIIALADHQTQGVGRDKREWLDKPNCSLMFSALFSIPQSSVAVFADMAALTICEVLRRETGISVQVKYPNDLVVEDRKVGGILVKNIYDEKLHYVGTNLGVGLNVHYSKEELSRFPTDYLATSLDVCRGVFVKRQDLLIEISRALRFLGTEVAVVGENPKALDAFEKKWRDASSVYGRKIAILKDDKIVTEGLVVNTGIGRGVELETTKGRAWLSLFETDMKARIS
jgi:BirA family biotin operon repressor/biotin-[acetyl-CoA-carboxylase] ligase